VIDSNSRRFNLLALVCAAVCSAGAWMAAPLARAATGVDASPIGEASIALPAEISLAVLAAGYV
jgi:hypothetical protein